MDEREWLASNDPAALLRCVTTDPLPGGYGDEPTALMTDRKLRLFACACCLLRGTMPFVVDLYEREGAPYDVGIDEPVSDLEWAKKWTEAGTNKPTLKRRAALIREIVGNPFRPVTLGETCPSCRGHGRYADCSESECADCGGISGTGKCGTGIIPPPWLTEAVVNMARTIYDERAWGDMGILADALEEAGCTDDAILAHCRGPGPHARGCWVVDLILGKV